jgi:peptidoglycan/LPS O-acetylase OafA/YrhL
MVQHPTNLKNHFFTIDLLKSLAVQIIILHHLSNYGEVSYAARELWPAFFEWLGNYGRFAVQIFFVMGGYLAIKNISTHVSSKGLWLTVLNRYLRLVPTYFTALLITILSASVARYFNYQLYMGQPETIWQVLSHLLLLQQILGFESISLGVWYVAIDWQLYVFFTMIFFLLKSYRWSILVLSIFMLAAFSYYSQKVEFEDYFIYFIGVYGLGMIAFLCDDNLHEPTKAIAKILFVFFGVIIFSSVLFDLSIKNVLAYAVALLLIWRGKRPYKESSIKWAKYLIWISQRSYCAFLMHFSFILLGNTVYFLLDLHSSKFAIVMMVMIMIASWVAAHFLYQRIEFPARKFQFR